MAFTQEDLERLKGCIDPQTNSLDVGLLPYRSISISEEPAIPIMSGVKVDMVALIARLEAAEKALKSCLNHRFDGVTFSGDSELYELWRKSCGK